MFKKNRFLGVLVYSLCSVSFYSCIIINAKILEEFFAQDNLAFIDFDNIELLKIVGYIIASTIVVLFTLTLSFYKTMLIAFPLNFLCCFTIVLLGIDSVIMMPSIIIYGATSLIMFLLFIGKMFELRREKGLKLIILILTEILIAYIIIVYLNLFSIDYDLHGIEVFYTFKASIIPVIIFWGIISTFKVYKTKHNHEEYNFNIVVKNMELEFLIAFVAFFVLMSIRNSYEVFSFSRNMYFISSELIGFIYFSAIVLVIILLKFSLNKYNIYKVNIISLICLILLFLLLPVVGKYALPLVISLILIGAAIGLLFIGNIFILTEKFTGINFTSAFAIYALASSMGYYCGYITINVSEKTLGPNGFLISICFVLTNLLIYHLYLFRKLKLYR